MPRFRDIPQFTRAVHESDHGGGHLEKTIAEYDIDLEPIYQREHVWTTEQQIAYVEFRLRGGEGGSSLYFNYIIGDPVKRRIEIVDGKQRITAARLFMADKLPAFGYTLSQYADRFPRYGCQHPLPLPHQRPTDQGRGHTVVSRPQLRGNAPHRRGTGTSEETIGGG